MKSQNKYLVIFFCLLVFLALTVLISLMTGRYMLMPTQVINILSNGTSAAAFDMESAVIWNLRIPRILLNILVGGALAIVGTVFQGRCQFWCSLRRCTGNINFRYKYIRYGICTYLWYCQCLPHI